jgi:hypothetical protein
MKNYLPWTLLALAVSFPLFGQGTLTYERIICLTPEQEEILSHMSIVYLDDGAGNLVHKTIRMDGVNLQIVNGLDSTNGFPFDPDSVDPADTVINGVGNLVVGYNELGNPFGDYRRGSHNIVVGHGNSYTSFGGFVGPRDNTTSAPFACVTAGQWNTARGVHSSVSGGCYNMASGKHSSVSGGSVNTASVGLTSVSGGYYNTASGHLSSVSGGSYNTASGGRSSVSGGRDNTAGGGYYAAASVSGGVHNVASGYSSSVSGGAFRSVGGFQNWRGGKYYSNN